MASRKRKVTAPKAARRKARKKGDISIRRKKEFTFRGFSLKELQDMQFDEVILLLNSRARRTLTRNKNEEMLKFMERIKNVKKDKILKTHGRDFIVLPEFVGRKVAIYYGKGFKEIQIKPEMIGHYFGEFAPTRGFKKHAGPGVGATKSSKYMPLK